MSKTRPILIWLRRDFRLSDHPAFHAACATGQPVIPVYILDDQYAALAAAPKYRLGLGIGHFAQVLLEQGSRLILRSGDTAMEVLQALIRETGASAVYWSRQYEPDAVTRDSAVKTALKEQGIDARSFGGHLMFEPWTVETQTGSFYKVYTPFWRRVKDRDVEPPLAPPTKLHAPDHWPASEDLADWHMGAGMNRGATVLRPFVRLGEQAAQTRLDTFLDGIVAGYNTTRDLPGVDGTSNLSENLALGEISPHQCWHAGWRALQEGKLGAEIFLKELVWREFAYHLMHHTPRILTSNWREEWEEFGWNVDEEDEEVKAWKQGRTGIPFVDAAMREMYVTGRMHNRGRMIVASYLTKHLLCHWRIGQKWFEECLIDWDAASNAMGWQWSAGSGPDATPYFRVFNPVTQLDKFDKNRDYADRWIAEGHSDPHRDALGYFAAIPRHWNMAATDAYPQAIVDPADGRRRALNAYENKGF